MTPENKAIQQELLNLYQRTITTGRKSYKRLSEIQGRMLADSTATAKRSIETSEKLLSQIDVLAKHSAALGEINDHLYWSLHEMMGLKEYQA